MTLSKNKKQRIVNEDKKNKPGFVEVRTPDPSPEEVSSVIEKLSLVLTPREKKAIFQSSEGKDLK